MTRRHSQPRRRNGQYDRSTAGVTPPESDLVPRRPETLSEVDASMTAVFARFRSLYQGAGSSEGNYAGEGDYVRWRVAHPYGPESRADRTYLQRLAADPTTSEAVQMDILLPQQWTSVDVPDGALEVARNTRNVNVQLAATAHPLTKVRVAVAGNVTLERVAADRLLADKSATVVAAVVRTGHASEDQLAGYGQCGHHGLMLAVAEKSRRVSTLNELSQGDCNDVVAQARMSLYRLATQTRDENVLRELCCSDIAEVRSAVVANPAARDVDKVLAALLDER